MTFDFFCLQLEEVKHMHYYSSVVVFVGCYINFTTSFLVKFSDNAKTGGILHFEKFLFLQENQICFLCICMRKC